MRTRWVLDASGRRAILRHQLGLTREVAHDPNAAWFRVDTVVDVETFSDHPGWRERAATGHPRYLSTNHIMGRGYWVWLIPLSSGSTSIGIVTDPTHQSLDQFTTFDKAMDWLDAHEPLVANAVRDALAGGASLQDYKVMKHFSHGSKQVFSANRWACTGDAGLFLDPFYSPGSDFIAISNTYITNLAQKQLDGHGIRIATKLFEKVYQTFFSTGLSIYQGQYPLFGNPKVMPVKVFWDMCYYWSLGGPLYFAGKLTSIPTLVAAKRTLDRAVALNLDDAGLLPLVGRRGSWRGPQRFHRPQQGGDGLGSHLPSHRTAPERRGQAAARQLGCFARDGRRDRRCRSDGPP